MAQPEKTFRIGACSASVFVNTSKSDDKRSFRVVSLQRRYKDGDEWKTSTRFTQSDLPAAIQVMQSAMEYLIAQEASVKA
ncbi:MAG: hypothetical protein IH987_16515 [Planctomycetes bacterium]|nr:hypothetical protein [Planctomycetota bacterium]